MKRSSGILMHISSLPSKYGIGTFGEEAYRFVDFLKKSGQRYWQILPLGQTGYGDSPYQCFSAFAGNPYFIDFDLLKNQGFLKESDYNSEFFGENKNLVDYGTLFIAKNKVLRKAYENSKGKLEREIYQFSEGNKEWLDDYALYMSVKKHFNLKSWTTWDKDIRLRKIEAIEKYKNELKDEINYWKFIQYIFFNQWSRLKKYANNLGIKIIGDIPIYVAEDSADLWSNPQYFKVDDNMLPTKVSGCPPDLFSETGQLWGNPIYNWSLMEKENYKWWIKRVRESLNMYDVIRIDHFRGFESYWEVPYGNDTAINGSWVKGPGIKLFDEIKKELGEVSIIAEDLGFLTEEVIEFRNKTGFPGMKVLQFAFGGGNSYLPHNYEKNCVVYTGTHDNDTIYGWYNNTASEQEVESAKKYLALSYDEGISIGFIRGAFSSVADLAITTMQDFLGLGSEARMNLPATLGDNWKWRVKKEDLTDELAEKIYQLTMRYERI
ncbi:4-alpha-glucanotransferase [Clostridium chauvoei]|uniref:4-alpha-glucanotransferase n=2 Tax=Clostridium chauvoei TaxID=46867 RepID=A0A1U6JLE2_9CLOT|nr:4-alpha-glucanotransferase [Clostridium chauvoei]SLK21116.1 Putative=4-alpha-glucanotransferase [Clostridium chauvoei JF4335]ATD56626.1 4-alpha-glucanotransferase [Clostridium chauvoei]MBX7280060.1 4-alpha-glucanotransferase [Clostridium chauvoei]MBX7282544.1 4-alpha-glucanotransferase [Clostridium chauvoei]